VRAKGETMKIICDATKVHDNAPDIRIIELMG
jgi:hypothetical protein